MTSTADPKSDVLWWPEAHAHTSTRLGQFLQHVRLTRDLRLDTYEGTWKWSVDELADFWAAVWEYFEVIAAVPPTEVVSDAASVPGARWFPGARLNYAENVLRRCDDGTAIIARSQTRAPSEMSWRDLNDEVARTRAGLIRLGVKRGDRVVAYLPNIPEAVIAYLAVASLGAIWASCAPESGPAAVLDRFGQIDPAVLLYVDGYRYGTRTVDKSREVATIKANLPTLRSSVVVPYLDPDAPASPGGITWQELRSLPGEALYEPLPSDHPLHILFSSGTTGPPKAIVHGHGGILIEHLKQLGLQADLGPGDRFLWFTTTGWMMWNFLVSGLAVGASVVTFDGDPGSPDLGELWRVAGETQATWFGSSAPFFMACRKEGTQPREISDLGKLRAVGSTGAPLPDTGYRWIRDVLGSKAVLSSLSGGTDVCTAFVGGSPLVPVWAGEISCRSLGASVEAFDPEGRPVLNREGELVLTKPMPSMPLMFWNDLDGVKLRAAYFERFADVWSHGDWITITERGTCIISGRSDATLNRGGVRLGTAEIYSVVEALDDVKDSLIVHDEDAAGGPGSLVLFIELESGCTLDAELRDRIRALLRSQLSPRHAPDEIYPLPSIPTTMTGKKLEVPVKRILGGADAAAVVTRSAVQDPSGLDAVVSVAGKRVVPSGQSEPAEE